MKTNNAVNSDNVFSGYEKTPSAYNAVSGLFILFSVFSLFSLLSMMIVFLSGADIDMTPIIISLMVPVALGITIFLLSYAIEMNIKLTSNGE